MKKEPVRVVDLFAGPGGLGEGFASAGPDSNPYFKLAASIEMEPNAHKTLSLRAFTREFPRKNLPDAYYAYLRGEISKKDLFSSYKKQSAEAEMETLGGPTELGKDNEKIHRAIKEALDGNDAPWVLIGGPPCQAYSRIGVSRNKGIASYRPEEDKRQRLYKQYLDIVAKFSPAIFVLENVGGMLSATLNGQTIIHQILGDVSQLAKVYGHSKALKYNFYSVSTEPQVEQSGEIYYRPKDFLVKAEMFGVPQARHRVILVGIREDFGVDYKKLLLSPVAEPEPVVNAIDNLPKLRSGLSKNDSGERWQEVVSDAAKEVREILNLKNTVLPYQALNRGGKYVKCSKKPHKDLSPALVNWFADPKLDGVLDHETRGHKDEDLLRYLFVSRFAQKHKKSPKLADFPDHVLPDHKNVESGKFVDRFKTQLKNKPALTVASHISKDGHYYIHYDSRQCRSFTVREAARIQTFPDNYKFEGDRTYQYGQVGNAVPPYLAYQIANRIYEILKDNI